MNASINLGIKNFNAGIYGSHMQLQIFPKFQTDPHAIETTNTVGVRFGYDIYPSKEKMASQTGNFIVVSPFIAGGYNWIVYSRLKLKNPTDTITNTSIRAFNIYSGINFNLMFSEYDGVGFTIGYSLLNHEFSPYDLDLHKWFNVNVNDTHGNTQYLFFGFNWYLDLGKRTESSD